MNTINSKALEIERMRKISKAFLRNKKKLRVNCINIDIMHKNCIKTTRRTTRKKKEIKTDFLPYQFIVLKQSNIKNVIY